MIDDATARDGGAPNLIVAVKQQRAAPLQGPRRVQLRSNRTAGDIQAAFTWGMGRGGTRGAKRWALY